MPNDDDDAAYRATTLLNAERYPQLRRRRFVMHVGAPKTGTTALQYACARGREALAEQGVWYPHAPGDVPHQQHWFVTTLLDGDLDAFRRHLDDLEAGCPAGAHTIFLSDEGIVNHLHDFAPASLAALRWFAETFEPACVYVTREPEAFLASLYREYLCGERAWGPERFGTAEPFEAWRRQPRMQELADARWVSARLAELFGADRLIALDYHAGIMDTVLALLPARLDAAATGDGARVNPSLTAAEAELVRRLNAEDMSDAERNLLVASIKHVSGAAVGHEAYKSWPVALHARVAALPADSGALGDVRHALLDHFAPRRVLLATVASSDREAAEAARLIGSLRQFGGTLAQAPCLVAVPAGIGEGSLDRLTALGATLVRDEGAEAEQAHEALFAALISRAEAAGFDIAWVLEPGWVVTGDPMRWLDGEAVQHTPGGPGVALPRAALIGTTPTRLRALMQPAPVGATPFPSSLYARLADPAGPGRLMGPALLRLGAEGPPYGALGHTDEPYVDLALRHLNAWLAGQRAHEAGASAIQPATTGRTAACTIIATNYTALARVFTESLQARHPEIDVHVLVIDPHQAAGEPLVPGATEWAPTQVMAPAMFTGMIARYDVTELSTALKPFFLKALFARGYDRAFYFDPDIRITGGLEALVAELDSANVVLTPHLLAPIGFDGHQPDEIAILQAGAYNLGFIGVANRPATHAFLDWWQARLETHCLNDVASGLFVDQKWVDLVPGLFEGVRVLRDPAYNVAYWNLHERRLAEANDRLEVNGRPLAFFHFSGFNPRYPQQLSKHQTRHHVAKGSVLARMLADYAAALTRNDHAQFAARPYGHGLFTNGAPFDAVCRALLLRSPRLLTTFTRPLDAEAEPSYFRWLNEPERGHSGPTRYMIGLYRLRPDVQAHYPDVFGQDQAGFLRWFAERAALEGASAAFVASAADEAAIAPVGTAAPAGVNVAGYLTAELGIGEAARGYVKAVRALDLEVALLDFDATLNRREDDTLSGFTDDNPYPVNLVCVNADQAPAFAAHVGPAYMAGKYNIGVWAWELPEFPAEWADRFAMFDEIWVGSAYMAEAVSRRSPIPVVSMPYVVDLPARPEADKAHFGLPPESFVFLFSFDYMSIFERKNPLAVVEAFKRAFPDAPSARLVLKSINGETDPANQKRLRAAAADDPRIVLLDRYMSKSEKNRLLASCDCYVSLHRSEGFGLGLAEAMALGKPVMATAWSGNLEFMTPSNSFLVGYELAPLERDLGPYKQGQLWAEPDVAHAAELMREVVDRPELAQSRARRAAADLRARHSPEALARRVEERLLLARAGRGGQPAPAAPVAGLTRPTFAQAIAYLRQAMTVRPELVLRPEWAQRSSYGRKGVLAKTAVQALFRLVHRAGP